MQGQFSMNSKVMQMLGRIEDLMVLNVVYVITCIPIFTIGAATAALYTVFPKSLLMAALTFFPVILYFADSYLYSRIGLIWYMLYYAVTACANVQLLRKVFAPFLPEPEALPEEDS